MFKEYFLDANAHLSLNKVAAKAYIDFHNSIAGHGHPSAPSKPGQAAGVALESARSKIASLIGAKANQIIFTNSCTQACEWGLQFLIHGDEKSCRSPIEHPAVREAFDKITNNHFSILPIDRNGVLNPEGVFNKICCIHTNNEIGVIQDLNKFDCNILFSDMSQSLGKIPVDVSKLNVDIAVFGAHKFGGPGNFGFIYLKDSSQWKPFGTGSRYYFDRPGTPDVASAVATAVALEELLFFGEKTII